MDQVRRLHALQNAIAPTRASRLLAAVLAHSSCLLAIPAVAQTSSATPANDAANSGPPLIFDQATDGTIGENLSGDGGLIKLGAGTLTLTGTNTYSGGTVVSAGRLQGDSKSLQGDIATANGTSIVFDQNTDGLYAGDMTGSGQLVKQGTGTLIVTGTLDRSSLTNSERGQLDLRQGTLDLDGGSILNSINIFIGDSGTSGVSTLRVSGSSARIETFVSGGVDAVRVGGVNSRGRLLIENGGSIATTNATVGGFLSTGEMIVDGSGSRWSGEGRLLVGSLGTGTLSIVNGGQVNTTSGIMGQNGTGTALISGAGSRWVSTTETAIGDFGMGTLTVTEGGTFKSATVNLAPRGSTAMGTLNIGTGGAAGSVDVDVINGGTANRSFLNLNHADAAYTLDASLRGQLRVNHIGNGTTILTGDNDYAGGTNLQAGTLAISRDTNLGNVSSQLSFGGGALRTDATMTSSRNVMLNAPGGTIDTNGSDLLLSGVIDGAGGLTKIGGGTLTLTGTNTYTGGTTVRNGTLSISADANLGNVAGGLALDGGALRLTSAVTSARSVSLGTSGGTIEANTAGSEFSGVISGDGSLTKTGTGTLRLSGRNVYSGGTTLREGTLAISRDENLGVSDGSLTFDGGTLEFLSGVAEFITERDVTLAPGGGTIKSNPLNTGTVTLSGDIKGTGTLTVAFNTGRGSLSLTGTNTYSGGTTLSTGTLRGNSDSLQGNIVAARGTSIHFDQNTNGVYAGNMTGSGGLTKNGTGTLTVTGTLDRSSTTNLDGRLIVRAGTLELDGGSILNSGLIVLGAGAGVSTLRVTGSSARVETSGPNNIQLGSGGTGRLLIENGGSVVTTNGVVGHGGSSRGEMIVDGSGSTWTGRGLLTVGDQGTGTLSVVNGGQVTSAGGQIGNVASGEVLISGVGSRWTSTSHVILGARSSTQPPAATITVADGGTLVSPTINLATGLGSGTLNIGTGGAAGFLDVDTVRGVGANRSFLNLNHTDAAYKLDASLLDELRVNHTGSGTTLLSGNSNYRGGTNIQAGTVAIFSDTNLGDVSSQLSFGGGTLRTDAALTSHRNVMLGAGGGTFNTNGFDSVFSGVIDGAGGLTKHGTGTLTLGGENTFSGGTTVRGGAVSISADSNLGAGGLALDGGTLQLSSDVVSARTVVLGTSGGAIETSTAGSVLSGVISGDGSLTKTGTGTLTLSGTNTFAGGTTLEAGTLSISADHNLGAAASKLTFDGGTVQTTNTFTTTRAATLETGGGGFDVSGGSTLTHEGAVTGSGELRKLGAGTLILNGENNYSGGTSVLAGTLRGDTTSIRGNVRNDATLVFDQQTDGTFHNEISGTGSLRKLGTAELTLRGANTFSGPTFVERGLLSVDGSLMSAVTVGNNAALGGIGVIHNGVTVGRGATLMPGNSVSPIHSLTIAGPLTLMPGSRLVIDADAAGNSDHVRVTGTNGTATIGGSTLRMEAIGNRFQRNTTYTVLSADAGVSGTFAAVSSDLAFLTPSLNYETNAVRVTLTRNDLQFSDIARGENERAVADYLDGVLGVDELIRGFDSLNVSQARNAFGTLSGEGLSSLPRAAAASTARAHEVISTRLAIGAEDAVELAPRSRTKARGEIEEPKAGGWARAIGASGEMADGKEASGYNWDTIGTAVGFERRFGFQQVLGASVMHTRSDVSFGADRRATGEITTPQALVYSSYSFADSSDRRRRQSKHVQLRGILGYARHAYETERPVDIGLVSTQARGSHDAQEWSAQGEVEFVDNIGEFRLQTLFGLRYIRQQVDGYTETGGLGALDVQEATLESVAVTAGGRIVRPVFNDRGLIEMRAQWSRELNDTDPTLSASLAGASNDVRFSVAGVPIFPDTFTLGASISGRVRERILVHADYRAELWRSGRDQQSIIAGFSYVW